MSQKPSSLKSAANFNRTPAGGKPNSENFTGSSIKVNKTGANSGTSRNVEEAAKRKSVGNMAAQERLNFTSSEVEELEGDDDESHEYGTRYITDELIRRVSKEENLERVVKLNLNLSKESPEKRIRFIENLEKCRRLEVLNLSYNSIERIQKIERLTMLRELNLSFNRINRLEGLDGLVHLRVLNLTGNRISAVPNGLASRLPILQTLLLAQNQIESLDEIRKLRFCANLVQFSFANNPCAQLPHARHFAVFHLRTLHLLDSIEVTDAERNGAASRFERTELDRLERTLNERDREFESLKGECEALRERVNEATRIGERSADERAKLKDELSNLERAMRTKDELVRRKTAELTRACHKHFELEQELAFFKIDAKFDTLGRPPIPAASATHYDDGAGDDDHQNSHAADIPYMGRARYSKNELPSQTQPAAARKRISGKKLPPGVKVSDPNAAADQQDQNEGAVDDADARSTDTYTFDGDQNGPESATRGRNQRTSAAKARPQPDANKSSRDGSQRREAADGARRNSAQSTVSVSGTYIDSRDAAFLQQSMVSNMTPKEVLLKMAGELGRVLPGDSQNLGNDDRTRLNELTLNAAKSILEAAAGQRFQFQSAAGSGYTNPNLSGNTINDREGFSSSHASQSQLLPPRSQSAAPILERGRLSRSRSGFATPNESNLDDDLQLDAALMAAKHAIASEPSSRAAGLLFGTQATATLASATGASVVDALADEIPPELLEKLHNLLDEELAAKQDAIQRTEERLTALQSKLETTENRVEVATSEYTRIVKLLAKRKRAQQAGGTGDAQANEADDTDDIPSDLQIDPSDMEALTALIEAGDDSMLLQGIIDEAQLAGDSQADIQDLLQKKLGAVNNLKGEADRLRTEMDVTEDQIKKQQREVENLRLSLKRLDSKESLYKEVQKQVNDKEQQLNANSALYNHLQKQLDVMLNTMKVETEEIRDLEVRLRNDQSEQNAETRRELETILSTMQDYLARSRRENEQQKTDYARLLEEKVALEKRVQELERVRQVRKTGSSTSPNSIQGELAAANSRAKLDPQQQKQAVDDALEMALALKHEKLSELSRMRNEIDGLEDELRAQQERQAQLRALLGEPSMQPEQEQGEAPRRDSAAEKYLNESTAELSDKQRNASGDRNNLTDAAERASQSRARNSSSAVSATSSAKRITSTPGVIASDVKSPAQTIAAANEEESVRRVHRDETHSQAPRDRLLPLPGSRRELRKNASDAEDDGDPVIEEIEVYSPNPLTPHARGVGRTGSSGAVQPTVSESYSDADLFTEHRFTRSGEVFVEGTDEEEADPDSSRKQNAPVAYTLDGLLRDGTLGADDRVGGGELYDMTLYEEEDVEYPEPDNPPPLDERVEPREFNDELAPTRLRTGPANADQLGDFSVVDERDDGDVDEMFVVLQQNLTASQDQVMNGELESHRKQSIGRSPLTGIPLPVQRGVSPANTSRTMTPASPSRLREHLKRLHQADASSHVLPPTQADTLPDRALPSQQPESSDRKDERRKHRHRHRKQVEVDENQSEEGLEERKHRHKHRHRHHRHKRDGRGDEAVDDNQHRDGTAAAADATEVVSVTDRAHDRTSFRSSDLLSAPARSAEQLSVFRSLDQLGSAANRLAGSQPDFHVTYSRSVDIADEEQEPDLEVDAHNTNRPYDSLNEDEATERRPKPVDGSGSVPKLDIEQLEIDALEDRRHARRSHSKRSAKRTDAMVDTDATSQSSRHIYVNENYDDALLVHDRVRALRDAETDRSTVPNTDRAYSRRHQTHARASPKSGRTEFTDISTMRDPVTDVDVGSEADGYARKLEVLVEAKVSDVQRENVAMFEALAGQVGRVEQLIQQFLKSTPDAADNSADESARPSSSNSQKRPSGSGSGTPTQTRRVRLFPRADTSDDDKSDSVMLTDDDTKRRHYPLRNRGDRTTVDKSIAPNADRALRRVLRGKADPSWYDTMSSDEQALFDEVNTELLRLRQQVHKMQSENEEKLGAALEYIHQLEPVRELSSSFRVPPLDFGASQSSLLDGSHRDRFVSLGSVNQSTSPTLQLPQQRNDADAAYINDLEQIVQAQALKLEELHRTLTKPAPANSKQEPQPPKPAAGGDENGIIHLLNESVDVLSGKQQEVEQMRVVLDAQRDEIVRLNDLLDRLCGMANATSTPSPYAAAPDRSALLAIRAAAAADGDTNDSRRSTSAAAVATKNDSDKTANESARNDRALTVADGDVQALVTVLRQHLQMQANRPLSAEQSHLASPVLVARQNESNSASGPPPLHAHNAAIGSDLAAAYASGSGSYGHLYQSFAVAPSGSRKQAQTQTLVHSHTQTETMPSGAQQSGSGGTQASVPLVSVRAATNNAQVMRANRSGRLYTYAHSQKNRVAELLKRAEKALSGNAFNVNAALYASTQTRLGGANATMSMNVGNEEAVQSYYCDVPEHHDLETYLNRLLARNEELEALLRQGGIAFRHDESGWLKRPDSNDEVIRELRSQVEALRRDAARKSRQRAIDGGPSDETLTTLEEDYTTDDSTRRRRGDDTAARARRHKLAESIRRLDKAVAQRDAELKQIERSLREEQLALDRARDATQREAEERGRLDAEANTLAEQIRTLEERRAYLVSECDCLAQTCTKRHADLADSDRVSNEYRERLAEIEAKTAAAVRDYERARADQRETLRETERLAEQVVAVRRELAEQSSLISELDAESRERLAQKRSLDSILKDVQEVIQLRDSDFQVLDRRCRDAAAQVTALQNALSTLSEQEREKIASLRNCDSLISEKHEELTKLERQVRDAKLDCDTIESLRAQKQTELQALENDCQQKAAVALRQCREAEARAREKEKTVRELHAATEALEHDRNTINSSIIEARREVEQLEVARTREQRTLDQLVSAITKQKAELRKALEELRDEQTSLQNVQRNVTDRQREADRLDARIETERSALSEIEAERRKRQTELDAVRTALAAETERRDATRTELGALETQLCALRSEKQSAEDLVEQTKRKVAHLRRSHEQTNELVQVAQAKLAKLETELDAITSAIEQKRSDRDALAGEQDRLSARVIELDSRTRALKQAIEEQEATLQRGADDLARRVREKDSLNSELAELRERADVEKQQAIKTSDALNKARDELKTVEAELFERQLEAQEARKTTARLKKECEKEQARVEKLISNYSHDLEALKSELAEKQRELEQVGGQLEQVKQVLADRQFTEAKLDKLEFQLRVHEDELRKTAEEKQQLSTQLSRALQEAQSSRELLVQNTAQLESRARELDQACTTARASAHEREREMRALRKATRQQIGEMEQLLYDYCFRLSEAQEELSAKKIEVLEVKQRFNLQLDAARVRESLLEEDELEREHKDTRFVEDSPPRSESPTRSPERERRKRSQRVTFDATATPDANGAPSGNDSAQSHSPVLSANGNAPSESDIDPTASIDSSAAELFAKTAARMSATDLKMQLRANGDRVRSQLRNDLIRNYSNMHGDANRTQSNLQDLKAKLRQVEAILADAGASRIPPNSSSPPLNGTNESEADLQFRNFNNLSATEQLRTNLKEATNRNLANSSFASLTTSNNYSQNGSEISPIQTNYRERQPRSVSLDKLSTGYTLVHQ